MGRARLRIRSEAYRIQQRKHKAEVALRRRAFALELLGGKCAHCGSTQNLEIDHKNKEEKSFAVSRPANDEVFKKELEKCQLLCSVCHRRKSTEEHSGEKSPLAKLTSEQVQEIRTRLAAGETGRSLAIIYKVCPMQISRIKTGKRWNNAQLS